MVGIVNGPGRELEPEISGFCRTSRDIVDTSTLFGSVSLLDTDSVGVPETYFGGGGPAGTLSRERRSDRPGRFN